jgi:hypothetical protein
MQNKYRFIFGFRPPIRTFACGSKRLKLGFLLLRVLADFAIQSHRKSKEKE